MLLNHGKTPRAGFTIQPWTVQDVAELIVLTISRFLKKNEEGPDLVTLEAYEAGIRLLWTPLFEVA
jgi:hypothetical protein